MWIKSILHAHHSLIPSWISHRYAINENKVMRRISLIFCVIIVALSSCMISDSRKHLNPIPQYKTQINWNSRDPVIGYDCGTKFFTDMQVDDAKNMGCKRLRKTWKSIFYKFPMEFTPHSGIVLNDVGEKYFLYPLLATGVYKGCKFEPKLQILFFII